MSFRDYLRRLDAHGNLTRVRTPISKIHEIAGVLKKIEPRPALFEQVIEAPFCVAGITPASRETARLDVSTAARVDAEPPSLAAINQSLTMALSRVNSDLINMFSSATQVFDSRPPSPTIVALKDTAGSVREALADWSSASVSSDSGWSSASDSGSSSWSGGGSSSGGSSGSGGGGFG